MAQKNYKSERQDYMTPPELYEPFLSLSKTKKFFIDVCCSQKNIPAVYHFIDGKINGLTQSWTNHCFMNPPFRYTKLWVKKAVEEAKYGATVFSILPADRLETAYYQEFILQNPNALFAFLPGKKGFIIPGQEQEEVKPSQKIMIVIFANSLLITDLIKVWNRKQLYGTVAFQGGGNYDE